MKNDSRHPIMYILSHAWHGLVGTAVLYVFLVVLLAMGGKS